MPLLTQMATSDQPVQQVVNPPSGTDPTVLAVEMAFIPAPASGKPRNPVAGDWNPAGWVTESGPVYWASCSVGPDGVMLSQGDYVIAVRIFAAGATPELWGWSLSIT